MADQFQGSIKHTAPNRIDLHISGKIDRDAMEKLLDDFVAAAEGMEHGVLFYRIENFQMPEASAIMVEFRRLPELFAMVRRFEKAAVIADEAWVRKVAEFESMLIPGMSIKGFKPGEEHAAEEWLAA